jgi:hypothetical protein
MTCQLTIAEPVATAVPTLSPDAPIWIAQDGANYRVGAGIVEALPENAWSPSALEDAAPPPRAQDPHEQVLLIAGMDALMALAIMGLTQPDQP